MGTSTDAYLFYGYCLKEEFQFEDEDSDWEERYAKAVGIQPPPDAYPEDGPWNPATLARDKDMSPAAEAVRDKFRVFWKAKDEAVKASGVTMNTHCSSECPEWFVAIEPSFTRAWRGDPKEIGSLSVDYDWNERLAAFCKTMGIDLAEHATTPEPRWWLASYWG